MRVGKETLELLPRIVTLLAEEEIVTVLTHPTILQDLHLAPETLVSLIQLDLWLKYHLQRVRRLVPPRGVEVGPRWPLKITLLT